MCAQGETYEKHARHEAAVLSRIGTVLVEQGHLQQACQVYRQLVEKEHGIHGVDHPATARANCRLAQVRCVCARTNRFASSWC